MAIDVDFRTFSAIKFQASGTAYGASAVVCLTTNSKLEYPRGPSE